MVMVTKYENTTENMLFSTSSASALCMPLYTTLEDCQGVSVDRHEVMTTVHTTHYTVLQLVPCTTL